jgi:hypothetical protein
VKFWDSSALVPLIAEERLSASCRKLWRSDPQMVVWALTRIEMASAVRRKERARELGEKDVGLALRLLEKLADRWTEVDALTPVRDRAERLVSVHPIASADALQLAAALLFAADFPKGRGFVTADEGLARAAARERFDVFLLEA